MDNNFWKRLMWLAQMWAVGDGTPEAVEAAAHRADESGAKSDAADLRVLASMVAREMATAPERLN